MAKSLLEALEQIASPKYGLQGILEDNEYESKQYYKELSEYYGNLARRYESIAREALIKEERDES